jgi:hypothetical protein
MLHASGNLKMARLAALVRLLARGPVFGANPARVRGETKTITSMMKERESGI